MSWKGSLFNDTVLPFGLRCAPKIFNAVFEWIFRNQVVKEIFHYLDNFLVLGAPGLGDCADALSTLLGGCDA